MSPEFTPLSRVQKALTASWILWAGLIFKKPEASGQKRMAGANRFSAGLQDRTGLPADPDRWGVSQARTSESRVRENYMLGLMREDWLFQ